MNLLLALFLTLPNDYINLVMEDKYDEAIGYCDEKIGETKGAESFKWRLEKGDIYLYEMYDLDKALEVYQDIIENYPSEGGFWIFSKRYKYPDLGWIYLRLAQALELNEDYLNSAKSYEIVATKFRKFPLDSFSLNGVERCFKKNYQDYVATIDGYNITRLELDERVAGISRFNKRDEKSVLDKMIIERNIYTTAIDYNVEGTDFFKKQIQDKRKTIVLEELYSYDVLRNATPTEKEMKNYYNKHKEDYKLPAEIRGKEIVVESDSIARFLLDSLTKNVESFDTLAKLYSTLIPPHVNADMGILHRGVKPQPVEDILFSTRPNELTGTIPFDGKFGIYLVTDYKPDRYREFDKMKSQIETSARSEKIKDIEEKFLKSLWAKAKIEIYEEDTSSTEENRVLASVNGRQILWSDLEKRNEAQPQFAQVNLNQPEERQKLLNTMIEEELRLERAQRNKYFLHDGYFTKMKDEFIKLMDQGLYTKIIVEGVSIDSQTAKDYYNEHKDDFKVPETVRCLEIVVDSKTLAKELRVIILNNPEKFDSLAREHSTAPTNTRGGDTDLIRRGIRSKKFEKIAFKLKAGTLSNVFSPDGSSYGFIKVVEHNPATYRPFEEMRSGIESRLLREKRIKVAEEFLAKIKEETNIEIFLDEPEEEGEDKKEE